MKIDYQKLYEIVKKLPEDIGEALERNVDILIMKDYAGEKCSYIEYQADERSIGGFAPAGVSIEDRIGNQNVDWAIQIPVGGDLSQVKIQIYKD